MKKIIIIAFLFQSWLLKAQYNCENFCLSFDDTLCLNQLVIDTSLANNIWQIGKPHKAIVDSSAISGKVIITDTNNAYPVNNFSTFTLSSLASYGDIYGFKVFSGRYQCNTDSLKDWGKIEFSYDKGHNWIDLVNDTTFAQNIIWYTLKPKLTGRSAGYFDMVIADGGSAFNIHLGDTLMYRFSFYSDSIFDNRMGILFESLCLWDFVEGITETHFTAIKSKIYPNPSADFFNIEFDNPDAGSFQLAVYDINSHLLIRQDNITSNNIKLDMRAYKTGMYVYKITNLKTKKRCWGKFIKSPGLNW